ncbi:acetylxylan esterase [Crossiella sp. SN42]|uniref:poly(ethylene terephthalate) hydrolase family protein n=1 Tax=Crossiella sp. SN42 TaxID=2944808 RepID=UPI00207D19EF|nr:acetylxylan esterase [Crossiella sp. SN42]MCO1574268.1 acetylxylan esterase [Crossiella sp. SN42]
MRASTTSGLRATIALLLAAGLLAPAAAAADAAPARVFEQPGPHQVTVVKGGPDHTLYHPAGLAGISTPLPVLVWGNGTGVNTEPYDLMLRHIASWGVVIAAANTTQSGSGQEMLAGARFLIAEDQRPGSAFHGKIDETRIAAASHSQGGGGAIAAGADPLINTTVPIQPGPQGRVGALHGPAFFVAGQVDLIVPSLFVRARYGGAGQVPAVLGEVRGGGHFLLGETRTRVLGAVTAWLRYWLAGDQRAKSVFFGQESSCELCGDEAWSAHARNDKAKQIS